MKNIFIKFLFVAALFSTQFVSAQSAKADADETPEKAAMKAQLRQQQIQQIQLEKQRQTEKKAIPVTNQHAKAVGSVGASSRNVAANNSKPAASGSNKAEQIREAKPIGGLANERITAAPGTVLDKQSMDKPAGKQ